MQSMEDLQTPPSDKPVLLPIWASIILYIIAFLLISSMLASPFYAIISMLQPSDSFSYLLLKESVFAVSSLISAWVCAWLFLKYVNDLPVSFLGMSIKGRWKDCVAGILFAAAYYAVGFGISIALKAFDIVNIQFTPAVFFWTFLFYLVAAATEEIMVRGYIQGLLMNKINKFWALIIASVVFSALHGFNSGIDFLPLLNLFISGLFLGASYMYTRNLWFPIFLHTTWNWMQGTVLGYKVSGTSPFPTMINLRWTEDNIINGGQFGFEGSIICTILTLIGTALIIGWYESGKRKRVGS